jgi:hypothetical protein
VALGLFWLISARLRFAARLAAKLVAMPGQWLVASIELTCFELCSLTSAVACCP